MRDGEGDGVRGGNNIVGWRQIVENNDVTDPLGGGGVRGRGEGGVPIGGFEDSGDRGPTTRYMPWRRACDPSPARGCTATGRRHLSQAEANRDPRHGEKRDTQEDGGEWA